MSDSPAARLPPEPPELGVGADLCGGANRLKGPDGLTGTLGGAVSCAPDKAAAYADPAYWDRRFAVEAEYEWCRCTVALPYPSTLPILPTARARLISCCLSAQSHRLGAFQS